MSWLEATGQSPEQLASYERYQRRIRVVASPRLREPAWERREDVVVPGLERLAAEGR